MDSDALLRAVFKYGADEEGINDRFGHNQALYTRVFKEFIDNHHITDLADAIQAKDYEKAFAAAHALKGLSGNIGLRAYYEAICDLVDSLRDKDYNRLNAQYAAVKHEHGNAVRLYFGEDTVPAAPQPIQKASGLRERLKSLITPLLRDKFLISASCIIFFIFLTSLVVFTQIVTSYRKSTKFESGEHLLETGKQISLYLEEQLTTDWLVAQSVIQSIVFSNYTHEDEAFLTIINNQRKAWNVKELMLYTENGYCVFSNGETERNGIASETLSRAIKNGRAFSIIDSQLTYTLPVTTNQTFKGSKILAVSVVRDMESFLDEIDFPSYNKEAWIYLTDNNGIMISMLSSPEAPFSFNINTILQKYEISMLSGQTHSSSDVYSLTAAAYYMSGQDQELYLVSVPIITNNIQNTHMRLFYIVPEQSVNYSSDTFSNQLTLISIIIIFLLVGLTTLVFYYIYISRKKTFDAAISTRDQMFDLLIKNLHTVFGLFNTDEAEPVYISSNVQDVLREDFWTIKKVENIYQAVLSSGRQPEMLSQVNEILKLWDGMSDFKSGYLLDTEAVPPTWFEMILFPVNHTGKDFVGIMQDVSATHEREEATKVAMEMAKRSDSAKTRFLANMSHDIRTPMNAIMNMAHFAKENEDNPEKRNQFLDTIYDSSDRLLHIINDILDMSRIESGQTVIASSAFDLKAELSAQVEALRPLCTEKNQNLNVDFDGIHAQAVRGDALKVSQIIMNLLSNAIKFTPEGGKVHFSAEELPSLRDDLVNVRFVIKDSGIGISKENMPHIFEPFARAKDSRIDRIEGTGLGLSICKSFVDAMGGTINCESVEGQGSTFTVELFFQKARLQKHEPTVNVPDRLNFNGKRCLVMEDVSLNRVVAKELLERLGFSVDFASNGEEGVIMFMSCSPQTYDVIYLDIQMPVMDGYQATEMIRSSEHPQAKTIPILAMSANVFAEDIEKARAAGMDGYVGKPIKSQNLLEQTIKAFEIKGGKRS